MNTDTFALWLRRQGHKVIRTKSSYWYDAAPHVFQAFPYHWQIQPSPTEIRDLLASQFAIALRYSTTPTASMGALSYHVMFDKGNYKLEDLPKKARHDIVHGLEYGSIEPIPMERLMSEGWALREDTLRRQGRVGAESQNWWQTLCRTASDLEGFEAWGVVHDGQLVAGAFTFRSDDCFSVLYQQSLTAHLKFGVNNALAFEMTRVAVTERSAKQVFYGLHSLDAPSTVDEFKFRLGFSPRPVRQRIVFNPLIQPFIHPSSIRLIERMHVRLPKVKLFPKLKGMMHFSLAGTLPFDQQPVPEVIGDVNRHLYAPVNDK